MTLNKLENRVAALLARVPTPLSFEEFKAKWEYMGELDKSIYISMAECHALFGVDPIEDNRLAAIFRYIEEMGLVKNKCSLETITKEMEKQK